MTMMRVIITLVLLVWGVGLRPALAEGRTYKVRSVSALKEAVAKAGTGDRIILRKGIYRLTDTLVVEGKKGIVIEGRGAQLNGGVRIPRRALKKCKEVLGSQATKGLRHLDISRYPASPVIEKGHTHPTGPSWSEFYADGVPMRLSQWPNDRWIKLDSVVRMGVGRLQGKEGPGYGIIAFKEDRPLEWAEPTRGWLSGCFRFGWSEESVGIKSINPDKTLEVRDMTSYGFGFKPGENFQKWKVLNIPEEVDEPGEYSLDVEGGQAWLMLPKGTRRLEMAVQRHPLLLIRNCEDVKVKGLEFCCTCGDGAVVHASSRVEFEDCELRNIGHIAIKITASCRSCGVNGCHIHDIGAGGVDLAGGDRKQIIRGDNYVTNCVFHDFNRIEKHLRPAVTMSGLGNKVSHCEFYDSASSALLMLGNDQVVEYSNFHHLCMDVEDNGALYHGRNPAQRGSVIRYNYFHDIQVPFNVRATYHDDGSGAVEVYGNIFDNISSPPVQIGGGSDVVYHDNIFMNLDCAAIKTDGRLQTWGADRLIAHRDSVALVDGPAFREHYPDFAAFYDNDYTLPARNTLIRNVFYNVKYAFEKVIWSDHFYNDDIEGKANFMDEMRDNWKTTENPGFVDPTDPLKGFVPDSPLLRTIPGFQLPPFADIPPTSPSRYETHSEGFSGGDDEAHTKASL